MKTVFVLHEIIKTFCINEFTSRKQSFVNALNFLFISQFQKITKRENFCQTKQEQSLKFTVKSKSFSSFSSPNIQCENFHITRKIFTHKSRKIIIQRFIAARFNKLTTYARNEISGSRKL